MVPRSCHEPSLVDTIASRIESSDTLVVRNFRFFRNEDDAQSMAKATYKPGDGVWAKFDITGFKYREKNKIDVSYVTSVIAPSSDVPGAARAT